MLTIQNLTKTFGGLAAVSDLSLTITAGEMFACIGPNGSGKTTTVKMLAGLYMPSRGTIEIAGINLADEPEKAKAAVGYIPDEPFIYEKMSGREFLNFIGTLYGMRPGAIQEETKKYVSRFPGLEEVVDGYVESYSRGNKQKLATVGALLHHPKLLLIDEPMVGLDPQSVRTVKDLIRNFAEEGGAVFLCTHTLSVAEELAKHIGILEKGKLIASGTLSELRTKAGLSSVALANEEKSGASLEEIYLGLTKA